MFKKCVAWTTAPSLSLFMYMVVFYLIEAKLDIWSSIGILVLSCVADTCLRVWSSEEYNV